MSNDFPFCQRISCAKRLENLFIPLQVTIHSFTFTLGERWYSYGYLVFFCATVVRNNDGIIFHSYSADLNLSDETHNAEGELSCLDCSLFPSNLLVCKFIVLKCFSGEDGHNGAGSVTPWGVRSPDNGDQRIPPTQICIFLFFSFYMRISLICILDKYVTHSYTWTKQFKLLKGLFYADGKSRSAKNNI